MKDAYAMYSSLPMSSGISPQHGFFPLAFPDYGSLYYCYLFSQALSRDLFNEFIKTNDQAENQGVQRYRQIVLQKGSSKDAEEMIAEFLGRDYNLKAYGHWVSEGRRCIEKTGKAE
jgi:thimet oligopeptidase